MELSQEELRSYAYYLLKFEMDRAKKISRAEYVELLQYAIDYIAPNKYIYLFTDDYFKISEITSSININFRKLYRYIQSGKIEPLEGYPAKVRGYDVIEAILLQSFKQNEI